MPLTLRATRSLVTALARGVQVVKLCYGAHADLDMETLAQYDGRGACRGRPVSGVLHGSALHINNSHNLPKIFVFANLHKQAEAPKHFLVPMVINSQECKFIHQMIQEDEQYILEAMNY